KPKSKHDIEVVVDRLVLRPGIESRLASSLETAMNLGDGLLMVRFENGTEHLFSSQFACPHGHVSLGEITPRLFSFNNPYGACPECTGLGLQEAFEIELVVSHPELSLNDGAIRVSGWNFADRGSWARCFIEALSDRYDFSLDTPWNKLSADIRDIILFGNHGETLTIDTSRSKYNRGRPYFSDWIGVMNSLEKRYRESSSDDAKEQYKAYMISTPCPSCHGARLKPEALAVTVGGASIDELVRLQIEDVHARLSAIEWPKGLVSVADVIVRELQARLSFLIRVGLNYLTLARASATLSGGEAQRIRLATQIGSGLMGVLYILDEPSIGLHQRDNRKLLATLKQLRDLGNTVIVVEHDEETIWEADHVVDIGPGAGELGGEIVAQGRPDDIAACEASLTGQYLSGTREIAIPKKRRKPAGWLKVVGAAENNLKAITVKIPLGVLCLVTGVSGSGKSSLVNGIVLNELSTVLNGARRRRVKMERLEGVGALDKVIAIDQSPIGRTPRSNPATYTGVFDLIRQLYAATTDARMRGYKPGRFSFNVRGGRCEACSGDGVRRIEMHFLSDMYVPCEVCRGTRYNRETLEVMYKEKNIADVLNMTVEEAVRFFALQPRILAKLQTLYDVGLGYVRLGQSSTQLSGGEAQRVKLATELSKRATGKTMYMLDEPTTGLHTADVHRLSAILARLVEGGNSVVVIEHNLD
ncbi:MAG TPA: excinuclease ABC subunit UvrA, partial [Clostridiaceae bacterium]|nr:excinuclease ABC subunit UvrA [Clostridiaceae bacterium]